MSKLTLLLIPLILLSSCTIDWNDEKAKKIVVPQENIMALSGKLSEKINIFDTQATGTNVSNKINTPSIDPICKTDNDTISDLTNGYIYSLDEEFTFTCTKDNPAIFFINKSEVTYEDFQKEFTSHAFQVAMESGKPENILKDLEKTKDQLSTFDVFMTNIKNGTYNSFIGQDIVLYETGSKCPNGSYTPKEYSVSGYKEMSTSIINGIGISHLYCDINDLIVSIDYVVDTKSSSYDEYMKSIYLKEIENITISLNSLEKK